MYIVLEGRVNSDVFLPLKKFSIKYKGNISTNLSIEVRVPKNSVIYYYSF